MDHTLEYHNSAFGDICRFCLDKVPKKRQTNKRFRKVNDNLQLITQKLKLNLVCDETAIFCEPCYKFLLRIDDDDDDVANKIGSQTMFS